MLADAGQAMGMGKGKGKGNVHSNTSEIKQHPLAQRVGDDECRACWKDSKDRWR